MTNDKINQYLGEINNCVWPRSFDVCSNLLHEAERVKGLHLRENTALRIKWQNIFHKIMSSAPDCPKNKVGTSMVSDIDVLLATKRQRAETFIKLFAPEKWVD